MGGICQADQWYWVTVAAIGSGRVDPLQSLVKRRNGVHYGQRFQTLVMLQGTQLDLPDSDILSLALQALITTLGESKKTSTVVNQRVSWHRQLHEKNPAEI
eukprot:2548434-Amphidinium_carterae.1